MEKIDVKRDFDGYRARRGEFRVLEVPEQHYLMVDGHGDPNTSPRYQAALESLYPVAYSLKFASKRSLGRDYVVPPLEGLWWADDMASFTAARDKAQWRWTMMLLVPEWLGAADVAAALDAVAHTHGPDRVRDLRYERLAEGQCVQTLHVGSYDDEGPVLAEMHARFIPDHGLRLSGTHHEIYLSDPRRVAPDKLRTILRQPVASA